MKTLDCHKEKLVEDQVKLDSTLVEIERLISENRHQKNFLRICHENEHEFKEEIISLKKQLKKTRRVEDVLGSQLKDQINYCENLEVEALSTINDVEKSKYSSKVATKDNKDTWKRPIREDSINTINKETNKNKKKSNNKGMS